MTMKDVAQEARVSIKTVSRVVNNEPYVREEVRRKVWNTIEKLNYKVAEEGRKLASLKTSSRPSTNNIGCVLFRKYKYEDPFFTELLEEIDKALLEFRFHHYFTHTLQELEEEALFHRMINPQAVDGCILIAIVDQEKILRIKKHLPNTILLCGHPQGDYLTCVYPDHAQGGYEATMYLISLGHRRIACVNSYPTGWYSQFNFWGYKKALQEAGIAYKQELVGEGKYEVEEARKATHSLLCLNPPPTAIFAVSDPMAMGVYKAVYEKGMKIPEDISIVGSDDNRPSLYLHPSLTTVRIPKEEMARETVRILREEIEGKRKTPTKIIFPVNLVKRDSCRAPRAKPVASRPS